MWYPSTHNQCVEEARMEVAFQTAFDVANVCPSAMDARIAQEVIGYAGINYAYSVTHRRSYLTTMSHVANVRRTNVRIILTATTGDAAGIGYLTEQIQVSITCGLNHNLFAVDIPDTVRAFGGGLGQ
jgi:hypothetical protein